MSPAAGSVGRPFVSKHPRLFVTVGLLILAGVVGTIALRFIPSAPLTYGDLKADPAFALRLADADELLEVGNEAQSGIDGSSPAFAGHVFGTSATSADVYSFYERELARLGWRAETPPYAKSGVELENRLYCKSRAVFRLAIEDKNRAFQPGFYKGRNYTTVFDATLLSSDPRATCPRPVFTPFPTITP